MDKPTRIPECFRSSEYQFCKVGLSRNKLLKLANEENEAEDYRKLSDMKKPFVSGWQTNTYAFDNPELQRWLDQGGNYGIVAGSMHQVNGNGKQAALIEIDADDVKSFQEGGFFDTIPEATRRVKTGKGIHFYYLSDIKSSKAHIELGNLGHFKFYRTQVLGPGSLHPSGNRYELIDDTDPVYVEAETLKKAILGFVKKLRPDQLQLFQDAFWAQKTVDDLEREAKKARRDRVKKENEQDKAYDANRDTIDDLVELGHDETLNLCLRKLTVQLATGGINNFDHGKGGNHTLRMAWATALIKSGYSDEFIHSVAKNFINYKHAATQYQLNGVHKFIDEGGSYHPCSELRAYIPREWCTECQWKPPEDTNTEEGTAAEDDQTTQTEPQSNTRHRIELTGDLTETLNAVLVAFYDCNSPPSIYQHGGALCRLKKVDEGKLVLDDFTDYALRNEFDKAAAFIRFRKFEPYQVYPPLELVRGVMALDGWDDSHIPFINGIVRAPVVRADGTVLIESGYDKQTGLYYHLDLSLVVSQIPDNVTQEDAEKAANFFITEVLSDFPFVDDASKANTIAAFLTPLVRPMIKGCVPMGLFDKPQPGTGASLLLELVCIVGTGLRMAAQSPHDNEEEWRKQITSIMRRGDQLTCLDNIASDLKSDTLSRVITSTVWKDRTLGKTETPEYPQRTVFYATGNNLLLRGDLPRRSYLIQVDAKMARPWERKLQSFRHSNIIKWVADNRGYILTALLTMVRAWVIAGRPKGSDITVGGFDEWVEIVDGILAYAKVGGFLGNLAILYEDIDYGTDEWGDFFLAWHNLEGDTGFTSGEILAECQNSHTEISKHVPSELADIIKYPGNVTKRFAHFLRKKLNVRYSNGVMLTQDEDKHTKFKLWAVKTVKDNAIS
ncbi:MAG: bifunctional DNA primase/polymerase [Methanotrichaceae archaeon]|nr:bifunctional DNA primase/polymerase [Methanotrichaceae archaeon]